VNVALLPSAFAPAVGGVEELTRRLADRLVAAGDRVEVWTIRHPAELPADETLDGLRVRRFRLPLPAARPDALARFPAGAAAALRELGRAADELKPDVLHVQCFSANGVYASALSALRRIPLVVSLQGETVMDDRDIYRRSLVLRRSLRLAFRRAAAVTGCSEFVLDDARRFGLRAGVVIPNAVEPDGEASPSRLELPWPRFVLALGRVVPKKGFDLLLEAFARVAPGRPDVGLVVAGDGPARPALERRATALGLERQTAFPGVLGRSEVAWAAGAADVFVLPSRVEPFGIVVLEALRAGTPAVVSCHGGAPEIVRDGREGLVVDPFDAEELARAIAALLDDQELRHRLGHAARRRVDAFRWEDVAGRYRELYRRVA
jgi:glycogen(starch) synthase